MEKTIEKKRDSNFELLRIIAMLAIISFHYIIENKLMNFQNGSTGEKIIFSFIYILTLVCINSFILISGYHLINSKFKIQKIIRLWGLAIFYSLGIYFFYLIVDSNIIDKTTTAIRMRTFAPILNANYWFLVPYLALYIIFPFLNKMIKSLNKQQLKILLIIFFILLSVLYNVTTLLDIFEPINGHSFLWFIFIYAIGAYIKLYSSKEKKEKLHKYKYLILYFITALIGFIINILLETIKGTDITLNLLSERLLTFNSVFAVIESISLFMFFKDVQIKNKIVNNIITWISPNILAVYLLHAHHISQMVLWHMTGFSINLSTMENHILHYIICVIVIFTIGIIIEQIRRWIFKLVLKIPIFKKLQEKVHKKYEKINNKINEIIPNDT